MISFVSFLKKIRFHIWIIYIYLSLSDFLHVSMIISRSIHVAAGGTVLFLFMTDLQHTLSNVTDKKKKICSSDPMSYCLCLGTWKTTLPGLLSTSCDYFWQMSHEHTGHLSLLVRSNGHWLCDYSDFLFFGSRCLGETHFLSWWSHRWKQSAFLLPKWSFFCALVSEKKTKKLCLC